MRATFGGSWAVLARPGAVNTLARFRPAWGRTRGRVGLGSALGCSGGIVLGGWCWCWQSPGGALGAWVLPRQLGTMPTGMPGSWRAGAQFQFGRASFQDHQDGRWWTFGPDDALGAIRPCSAYPGACWRLLGTLRPIVRPIGAELGCGQVRCPAWGSGFGIVPGSGQDVPGYLATGAATGLASQEWCQPTSPLAPHVVPTSPDTASSRARA